MAKSGENTGTLVLDAQGQSVPDSVLLFVESWRAVQMSAQSHMQLTDSDGKIIDEAFARTGGYTDSGILNRFVKGLTLAIWTSNTGKVVIQTRAWKERRG